MAKQFGMYELDAYLGDHADDFDVDAIIDEATEIDYSTGNRVWREDVDLAEICKKHDMSIIKNEYGYEMDYNAAVQLMDDDIRERLHVELAPCTNQEFFDAYCEAHEREFGEEWELSKQNPVW